MSDSADNRYAYMNTLREHLTHLIRNNPGKTLLVGIDGRCASGKTTAAALLHEEYGWPVVHSDDFFLRPEQRTPERYAEPGGNLDRERLKEEVLSPLKEGKPVSFQRFDCSVMRLGEVIDINPQELVTVEGSYSLHPELREFYDLKIFLDVPYEEQLKRIEERSGKEKLQMFIDRWIPLEERYFAGCGVAESADIRINTSTRDRN